MSGQLGKSGRKNKFIMSPPPPKKTLLLLALEQSTNALVILSSDQKHKKQPQIVNKMSFLPKINQKLTSNFIKEIYYQKKCCAHYGVLLVSYNSISLTKQYFLFKENIICSILRRK